MSYTRGKGKSSKGKEALTKAGVLIRAYAKVVNKMPEFTVPSRKVDDRVDDRTVKIPSGNMTSVVKTQKGYTSLWELYDNEGGKVLEVREAGKGLRITAGPERKTLGFVGGEWVVIGEGVLNVARGPTADVLDVAMDMLNMGTTITDVADMVFDEPTGDGEYVVAQVVVETVEGKEYFDPTGPTEIQASLVAKKTRETFNDSTESIQARAARANKKTIRESDEDWYGKDYKLGEPFTGVGDDEMSEHNKDDDTAAPGINESAEGWYVGTDPQDDGEAMGDGLDEKDEYDRPSHDVTEPITPHGVCTCDCDWCDDCDYGDAGPVGTLVREGLLASELTHPEHCDHCVLKEPALAHEVVKNRMEHREELIISLRTILREVLTHRGLAKGLRNKLVDLDVGNAQWQVEKLKVNEILDEAFFLTESRPLGSYDVITVNDLGVQTYYRIGKWIWGNDGNQTLMTSDADVGGMRACDTYQTYKMAREAVEMLNGKGEENE